MWRWLGINKVCIRKVFPPSDPSEHAGTLDPYAVPAVVVRFDIQMFGLEEGLIGNTYVVLDLRVSRLNRSLIVFGMLMMAFLSLDSPYASSVYRRH